MINKIEEHVLKLIDEIDSLLESEFNITQRRKKAEAVNPDGKPGISPADYDKRLAVLRAQQQAADPASKLAQELPKRIDNLEKAKQRAYNKKYNIDFDSKSK